MISTDDKIVQAVINSFSIKDLENIISKKKSEIKPKELTPEQIYRNRIKKYLKQKLFAPKFN